MEKYKTIAVFLLLCCALGLSYGSNVSLDVTKTDTIFKAGSLYKDSPSYGNLYGTTPDNDNSGRIGSYSMQSSVNECGASEIVIPLEFNEGINGMTPKLSLCYNSQAGNGIMGLGWSLGGMSKISRVPYSYIYNDSCSSVHFSDNDMLSLDGNTLIKGTKDGLTCYYPEIYDFSIVYPITNGYKVLKSNGIVNTYTSQYMLQGINVPIEWHLTRSEDPFGNYIEYFYTNDAANGAMYPTSIKYTGTNSVLPKYEIIFNYDSDIRSDCPPKWFSQSSTATGFSRVTKRIRSIQLNSEGAKILEYFLTYTSTSLDWNIRALCEIAKSYYEVNNGDNNLDYAYNKLSPIKFEWEKKDYALKYESVDTVGLWETYDSNDNQWAQSTAFAARFSHTSLLGSTNYVQDVVLLIQNQINLKYRMHVLTNNNTIGQTLNQYDFFLPESNNCQIINNNFNDGRSIDAFMPADTDGDGLNEVVCVSSMSGIRKLSLIKPNSNGMFNETIIQSNLGTYQYSNFHIGDFNGDGLSDLMCIKDNTTMLIWMSTATSPLSVCINKDQITTSSSSTSIRVCVGDFCGDKRDKILILTNETGDKAANLYQVRESSNNFFIPGAQDASEEMAQNYFSGTYRLCQGDFNGDGKQDIVLLRSQQWKFYFSKGNGVFSDALVYSNSNITSDAFAITNESNTNNFSFVTDLDQDGCDDISILKIDNLYNNTYKGIRRRDFLIRPTNTSVIVLKRANLTSGGADICIDSVKSTETTFGGNSYLVPIIGNFKGVLPNEIMSCRLVVASGTENLYTRFRNSGTLENPPVRAISKIISNFGAITKFEYCPMSYQSPAAYNSGQKSPPRDLTAVLPYYGYLNIVKEAGEETQETGSNSNNKTFRTTRYHFSYPRYHTRGRGFLGFLSSWNRLQGQLTKEDIQTCNAYAVDQRHYILIPASIEKRHFRSALDPTLLTHTQTTYTYVIKTPSNNGLNSQLGQIPNGVFYPCLYSTLTINNDETPCKFVRETFTRDNYGNITVLKKNYGTSASSFSSFFEQTNFTYENNIAAQRWFIGMPTCKTTIQRLNGDFSTQVVRTETYTNNINTGVCTSRTVEPNSAKTLEETYTYDSRGNMIGKTATNMGMTLTESKTYNAFGQVQTSTNALGHTTSYQYDYAGRLVSLTDPNDLVTEYEYNVLGDPISTNHPDGLVEQRELRWVEHNTSSPAYHPDTPNGLGYPVYFEWKKLSTGEESYTFYDQFCRKIRDVSYSIDNKTIYVNYGYYDKSQQVFYMSNPYFPEDTARLTFFEYDYLGRLVKTTRPDGSYSTLSFNDLNSTKRDFDGQTTKLTYNRAGLVTKSENGSDNQICVDFTYYGDGLTKTSVIDGNNATKISYHYDIHRHSDSIVDSTLGSRFYNYDVWGNLRNETTPKGSKTYGYDQLFRPTLRIEPDGSSQWTYDTDMLGMVSAASYTPTSGPTVTERFEYDNYGHITKHSQIMNGDTLSFSYTYDSQGRQTSITYPRNIKFYYYYATNGMLQKIGYTSTNIYWNALATNAFGKTNSFKVGNLSVNHYYDSKSGFLTGINATRYNVKKFSQAYQWSSTGNLTLRTDTIHNRKESFTYDDFNRLVGISATAMSSASETTDETITYDNKGNIGYRGPARYVYGGTSPYAVSGIRTETDSIWMRSQSITYTSFDKLKQVRQTPNKIVLNYGIDRQRVFQTEITGTDTTRTKRYFTPLYEEVTENGQTTGLMYIVAPTGLCCIAEKPVNYIASSRLYYALLDHQGSLAMVIKSSSSTCEYLSYDAWGRRRNPASGSYNISSRPRYDRGYTMHEHYDNFDLINMNGRLYAPVIGRMLQPDIVIQDKYNSQAYNSYSYCLNNPLRYTDPSGYVVNDANPPFYFMLLNPNKYLLKAMGVEPSTVEYNTDNTQGTQRINVKWIYDGNKYEVGWVHQNLEGYYQKDKYGCMAICMVAQEKRFDDGNPKITEDCLLKRHPNIKGTETFNGWLDFESLSHVYYSNYKETALENPFSDEFVKRYGNIEKYIFDSMNKGQGITLHYLTDNPDMYHAINVYESIKIFDGSKNRTTYNIKMWDPDPKIGGSRYFSRSNLTLVHKLRLKLDRLWDGVINL